MPVSLSRITHHSHKQDVCLLLAKTVCKTLLTSHSGCPLHSDHMRQSHHSIFSLQIFAKMHAQAQIFLNLKVIKLSLFTKESEVVISTLVYWYFSIIRNNYFCFLMWRSQLPRAIYKLLATILYKLGLCSNLFNTSQREWAIALWAQDPCKNSKATLLFSQGSPS